MVTFTGPPVVAVAAAVKVTTLLLPVVGSGLKTAVTPVGRPLALRSTEAVKLVRVMAIVLVAVAPWVTLTAAGEADSVKFDDGFTVSAMVVVRVSAGVPPVPLMVTFTGPPVVAVAAAVKVTTLLLPVVGSGLKTAVTPVGRPLALRSTEAVKLVRVMAIVLVAVVPG